MAEWTTDQIKARIRGEADAQKVDPNLALAVAMQESYLNPNAKGDNGNSLGLFQLQPAAAIDVGVNPKWRQDPDVNIYGGVKYLSQKLQQSKGNVEEALRRYNGGGDPNYVQNVLRFFKPGVAEAAERPQSGTYSDTDVQNALQALQGAQEPSQPQAGTYGEEDVQNALKALGGTQAPPPVSQATPTTQTPPGASQAPSGAWTPGMRFQALPSITQLEPADRMQKTKLFQSLDPKSQEEFLRSEEPASDLTVDIEKPSTPQARGPVSGTQIEPVTEGGVEQLLADQRTGLSLGEHAKVGAATGLGIGGTLGGAFLGGLTSPVTGPVGPIAGAALGGGLATRASTALGLTPQETPLVETPYANLYPSDVVGTALNVAAPLVARGVARVGNALGGIVKPAYQSLVDTAEKYGIRLSYGDVTQRTFAPSAETFLEKIPGSGAASMRIGQQADVTRAGETLRTGLQTEMKATPWRDLASVQQAARGTGPRAKEAQFLLDEINAAGDDWGRVVQSSGKLNLFQDRIRAEKLYTRVEELAQPLGNMRLPKATQAIDNAIARASDDVLPSPEVKREVIGALNRIKGEISPTESVKPSMGVRDPVTGTLRAEPVTTTTSMPDTTYSRMRRLRSSLGDLQREAAEPATARYLSGVKTALEEDMAEFAAKSNVPHLAKAAKAADTFYRTRIVPYREGQLAKAIEKDLPDEIYNQFVRRGKDRAEYFYKGLDPKGQAAVRYGMVEEAIEKATSGKPGIFSPERFATSLKKIQDAHGVFFKGTPQWEIDGVTTLMQHAKRAGEYMENPPTGWRAAFGTGMISVASLANVPAVVAGLLQAQGLRGLLMTQRGRNFLLAASDLPPGSVALQRQLDAFLRTLPAGAAGVGAGVRATEETAVP